MTRFVSPSFRPLSRPSIRLPLLLFSCPPVRSPLRRPVRPPVHPSVRPSVRSSSVRPSVRSSVLLSARPFSQPFRPSTRLCVSPSIRLSARPYVGAPVHPLSVCPPVRSSMGPSARRPVCPPVRQIEEVSLLCELSRQLKEEISQVKLEHSETRRLKKNICMESYHVDHVLPPYPLKFNVGLIYGRSRSQNAILQH